MPGKTFSSLAAVMALWLGVSFLLWLIYRIFRRRDGSKQTRLLSSAMGLIDEAVPIFAALRTRASSRVTAQGNYRLNPPEPEESLREDVRSLLNAIEAQSPYFERINATKKKIQNAFDVPDFSALSEILQIRRDFWAASEIFLMDAIRELDPEFSNAQSFEVFQAEALALLFKDHENQGGQPGSRDPVELRLAIAREDALGFKTKAEQVIAAGLEQSRFPTPAELIAVPWSLIKGVAIGLREIRYLLGDAVATARSLARAVSARGLAGAAEELRRARALAPGQFATAFERAGGLARQGGQGLKRHYEFVLEAQELRARYAELLARAPDLSDKGKQFLTRLELERRAELLRVTSGNLVDGARQALVMGIAYLIAGLQVVQAKITPAEHKQLAPLASSPGLSPAAVPAPAASETEQPLRALLLPASSYAGGYNRQQDPFIARRQRSRPSSRDTRSESRSSEAIVAATPGSREGRLRDLVTGQSLVGSVKAAAKPPHETKPAEPRVFHSGKPEKKSLQERSEPAGAKHERSHAGTDSLLGRLSGIDQGESSASLGSGAPGPEIDLKIAAKAKGWRLFSGSKRK